MAPLLWFCKEFWMAETKRPTPAPVTPALNAGASGAMGW